jgi:hypothetical protein
MIPDSLGRYDFLADAPRGVPKPEIVGVEEEMNR